MLKREFPKSFRHALIFSQLFVGALLVTAVTSCACSDSRKPEADKKRNEAADRKGNELAVADAIQQQSGVKRAVAIIKPIKGNQVQGKVFFKKVDDGIRIVADIDGLTPGKHGFHIHEFGDCGGDDGAAAGAHFNPTNKKHGGPDSEERHVGDLGNLVADEKGHAHYERIDKVIAFEGANSIIGRSVIIHADADDYKSQPAGASGAKIACGVIEAESAQ